MQVSASFLCLICRGRRVSILECCGEENNLLMTSDILNHAINGGLKAGLPCCADIQTLMDVPTVLVWVLCLLLSLAHAHTKGALLHTVRPLSKHPKSWHCLKQRCCFSIPSLRRGWALGQPFPLFLPGGLWVLWLQALTWQQSVQKLVSS
jgi:hypothetical protein